MPSGPAPTIAHDLNSAVAWWVERLAALAGLAEDAAQALRSNAEAYEGVDQGIAERLVGRPAVDGGGVAPGLGTRAL